MDYNVKTKRDKKSDKAQKSFDKNGGFSQRHVRLAEALAERTASTRQAKTQGKK